MIVFKEEKRNEQDKSEQKYADPTTENKKKESGKAENNRTDKNKTESNGYFGTVCEIQRNSYNILVENKTIHAKLKGNFFQGK